MNYQYKKDEKIIKDIIKKNVKRIDDIKVICIIIYYCNIRVKNLIMANDLTRNKHKLTMSHVIYDIKCPRGDCVLPNPSYIDQTRNTLKTRLIQDI